jgi:hypothetical protein
MNRTLVPATKPTTVTVIVDPELRDELTRATQLTGTLNISAISSAVRRRSLTAPISLLRFEREPTDLRDRGLHRPGCGVHRCLHASRIRRSVPQRWRCKRGGSYHRLSAPWGRRVSVGWSNPDLDPHRGARRDIRRRLLRVCVRRTRSVLVPSLRELAHERAFVYPRADDARRHSGARCRRSRTRALAP